MHRCYKALFFKENPLHSLYYYNSILDLEIEIEIWH